MRATDRQEIAQLTARVAQLSRDLEQRRRGAQAGEVRRIKAALQAHLHREEAHVQALTRTEIDLKAQLQVLMTWH